MIETHLRQFKKEYLNKSNFLFPALLNGLCLVLIVLPVILIGFDLTKYGYQIPVLDDVDIIRLTAKLHAGNLTLNDLWTQYNDHRTLVWRVLDLALIKVSGYTISNELWVGFSFAVLTLAAAWRLVRLSLPRQLVGLVIVVFAWQLFSTSQWQNWEWAFQPPWFLVNLLVILTVLLLSYYPVKSTNFVIAVGLSVVASFTVGSALPIWLAVLVGMSLNWQEWRWKYVALWLLGATGTLMLYFSNYDPNPKNVPTNKLDFLQKLPETAWFIPKYLGAPLASWSSETEVIGWVGLLLIVLALISIGWLWRRARLEPTNYDLWLKAWPWLVICLFSVFNAALTAMTRIGGGWANQSLTNRYTTVSLWFCLAVFMLTGLAGYDWFKRVQRPALKQMIVAGAVGLILVSSVSFSFTYSFGLQAWQTNSTAINETRPFFYEYETAPADPFARLTAGRVDLAQKMAALLSQSQEGPFRVTKEQYWASQNSQWQMQLAQAHYQPNIYPGNLMVMNYGDGPSLAAKEDHITFQHSGSGTTDIRFDLAQFKQAVHPSVLLDEPMIEIQTKTAQYVRVFFDTGHGFNYDQRITLAAALELQGQRLFRLKLPSGTQRLQISSIYLETSPQQDSLKVIVYTKGN